METMITTLQQGDDEPEQVLLPAEAPRPTPGPGEVLAQQQPLTRYQQLVRASALYDLFVTAPFATPWTFAHLYAALGTLGAALGTGGDLPAFTPMHTLFANLMGSIVLVWSVLRIRAPRVEFGIADGVGRVLFASWQAYALVHGATRLLAPFLVVELAFGVAQLAPAALQLLARRRHRPVARRAHADWLVPTGLILLSLVPAIGGVARLHDLASGAEVTARNARFHAAPLPVAIHVVSTILYSILGAFQFSPGFRRRHRAWHRVAGRVLIPAGLLVALTGLWMTLTYPWPAGDGVLVYLERLVFGSAMLVALVLGVESIRQRRFVVHGEWMIRAYAIGLGAGTQVLTHLPWFLLVKGWPGELPRAVMMGSAWIINMIVAEWLIRRRTPNPHAA